MARRAEAARAAPRSRRCRPAGALGAMMVCALAVATLRGQPAVAAASGEKVRVSLFVLPATGFSEVLVARLSDALRDALRKNPNLAVKDWNKLLMEFSGETPSDALREAESQHKAGTRALLAGDAAGAAATLTQALASLENVLAFTKKAFLAEAQIALGVAQARDRRRRAAFETFAALLVWRPSARFDTARYGTDLVPLFEKARAAVKRLKRGSVELTTDPPGARAYVDGRFVGVTPTIAFGLTVGAHYAVYKMPGFIKSGIKVTVDPAMQQTSQHKLRRSEKFLLMQQTLKEAARGLGRATANSAMLDLRSVLFVDQVVFAAVGYDAANALSIQAYVYDLRSKLRLAQTSIVVDPQKLAQVEDLARLLYVNARYDGDLDAPPEPPPPPPAKRRRFYATWWFWTAVAAGAAAVTLTAVLWPTDDSCQGNVGAPERCVRFPN